MLSECPHCGYELEVFDKLIGRRVKCPRCGERFRARSKEEAPARKTEPTGVATPSKPGAHFLTRELGVFIGGLVAVGVILAALAVRMYLDYQRRQEQTSLLNAAQAEKAAGDQWLERGDYTVARSRYLAAKELNQSLEVPSYQLRRDLDRLLETDEIKYLGRGWVQFRGQWMPESD